MPMKGNEDVSIQKERTLLEVQVRGKLSLGIHKKERNSKASMLCSVFGFSHFDKKDVVNMVTLKIVI